ncbi:MAG: sigma-54-dependent Fis family transcriptional regulator [bacterium]|nr:sigma-54-dependent Fis family transcriptional regulator [bacterium]
MSAIKPNLLVLDQSGGLMMKWGEALSRDYDIEVSREAESAYYFFGEMAPDAIIAHIENRSMTSLTIAVRNIHEKAPELPIIAILSDSITSTERQEILHENFFTHLESDIDFDELKIILERSLDQGRLLQERFYLRQKFFEMDAFELGGALATQHDQIQQAASSGMGVMIYGDPGSGLREVAKKLHLLSDRGRGPFVVFNPTMLSVEDCRIRLFGREVRDGLRQKGLLEMASHGTILFEEIGKLPVAVHTELYRVLVEGRMTRVGGIRSLPVRVRIIATSSLDLLEEVRNAQFHEGLFNKIHVYSLSIPPLKERREDIPALLRSYLRRFSRRYGRDHMEYDKDVEAFLTRYSWPGSIEELRKGVELAVLRSGGQTLRLSDFGVHGIDVDMLPLSYKKAKKLVELDFKRRFFDRLLVLAEGKVTKAAEICGIPRPSLSTMLKEAGIHAADYKRRAKMKRAAAAR